MVVGQKLGRYEIVARIGAGAMGEVYRARDPKLQRDVAVKVLPARFGADADRRRNFEKEARAAAALEHSNIITVYDVGVEDGVPFIVTELLDGTTLADALERGPLARARAIDIGARIARGMAAAHERGIAHRDLKPANVFLCRDGRVKILDFGLATRVDERPPAGDASTVTEPGAIRGTPAYMAPEQVRGERADHRSDLFACGVVLYEMLSGRRPYQGENAVELAHAILTHDPEPLADPALDAIVRHCLAKDPAARFQSASDLAFALETLDARPGRAASPRRWRVVLPPLAIGTLAVAGLAFYLLARPRHEAIDRSIAVLPFRSLSPLPNDSWFADGIYDELLTQLTKIGGLKVISRTSVAQYREGARHIREIADSLGVGAILEGSVQRSGNRVRVEAQLIDARNDKEIWAERYDRELTDVFAIESAVAEEIAEALHAKLSPGERARIERKPTESTEAYEFYLRGLEYWLLPTRRPENWQVAEQLYRKAIELDPSFALAHARLGILHVFVYTYGVDASAARLADARNEADRALALQPDLPEAHLAAGNVHRVQHDHDAALKEFQLVRASAPSNVDVLIAMAYTQRRMGRVDEAAASMRHALRLDPRSTDNMYELGVTLVLLRDYPEADELLAKVLSLTPNSAPAMVQRARVALLWKGDAARAKAVIARYPTGSDPGGRLTSDAGLLYLFKAFPVQAAAVVSPLPFDLIVNLFEYYPKALLEGLAAAARGDEAGARSHYQSARVLLESAVKAHPDDYRWRTSLGQAYALLGREEDADREGRLALQLVSASKDQFVSSVILENLAEIHARIGDVDAAMKELEELLSMPAWISPALLRVDERWAPLRSDPRFRKLANPR